MKILNLLFILIFLTIISIPSWVMLFQAGTDISAFENRNLAQFPNLRKTDPKLLPEKIQHFFDDHFGYRSFMLQKRNELQAKFLNMHGDNRYMLLGKEGFYFLNPVRPKDPKLTYKTTYFTNEELKTIKDELEKENEWLKRRDIKFMFVVVPDKEVIYPEYFPFPNDDPSDIYTNIKLDQLIEYLKNNSTFQITDLRQTLLEAKKKGIVLYYKGDSHWNEYGSFYYYQTIMKHLHNSDPSIYVPKMDDFEIENNDDEPITGDLARISMLTQDPFKVGLKFTPKPHIQNLKKLNSIFMYADSFSRNNTADKYVGVVTFLPLNFEDIHFNSFFTQKQISENDISPLEYELIDKVRPAIVVREIVERNLRYVLGPEYRQL